MNLGGRDVLVVGLGESGAAAARVLAEAGARVAVTDAGSTPEIERRAAELRATGVEVETGAHGGAERHVDLAVISPGIPPHAPVITRLAERGVEMIGEVELAYRLARCDILAVTGTNGKTTTTTLLADMLAAGGIESLAAGNIGLPLIDAVGSIGRNGAIAAEVSSFQLASIVDFRPRVAVVLNIAEDHTDWHGTFEHYVASKARITMNQGSGDHLVFNADDEHASAIAAASTAATVPFSASGPCAEGAGVTDGVMMFRGTALLPVEELGLPGHAGLEDALAAAAAAIVYGIDPNTAAQVASTARPLPHRGRVVATVDGVDFIDDSKATNPHATLAGVRGLEGVVLIAGGRAKGIDLTPLRATVPPVVAVVALGESRAEVERVFEDLVPVEVVDSMDEAVTAARALSVRGGSVLLSPGCASLDMYDGYAARGDDFARAARALQGAGSTMERRAGGNA